MSDQFIGEIRLVGFNFAPVNWAFCDGSTLSISQFDALYNLIGTTYGGDGIQTFNLPNLLGRTPVHMGTDKSGNTYIAGQIAGSEAISVNTSQLPAHSHTLMATTASATTTMPGGQSLGMTALNIYTTPTNVVTSGSVSTADPAGGPVPHDNMMPFLAINAIIALYGIYPSQG